MADEKKALLAIGPAPHILSPVRTPMIQLCVLLALLPVTMNGIRLFGLPALILVLVSVGSAVLWEFLFQLATRQKTRVGDLSAAVTGLLLALSVPAGLPPWMAALGTLFAIVVAKEFFGGIGSNPFNPALVGRAALLISFPAAMTTWVQPGAALTDSITGATPLNAARQAIAAGPQPLAQIVAGLPGIMSKVGPSVGAGTSNEVYWTLFLGNHAGSIGETSIALLLIGGLFLLLVRVIDALIPLSMLGAIALASWALGIDPLFSVLSGGAVMAAFFMATDYSSAPMTVPGKLIYGAGIGALTVLIRRFSSYPEGITFAILMMNAVSPFLNRMRPRKYGWRPAPKASPAAAAKPEAEAAK